MTAMRCPCCATAWPLVALFERCPECDAVNEPTAAAPISNADAFERWYVAREARAVQAEAAAAVGAEGDDGKGSE